MGINKASIWVRWNNPTSPPCRAGTSALTGIADPPSPSKPGSMEDAIKLWLKIGNIEKLQARVEEIIFN